MDANLNDYKDLKLKLAGLVPPATASTAGTIRIPNCPTCASAYASQSPDREHVTNSVERPW